MEFSAVQQFVDKKNRNRNIAKLLQARDSHLGTVSESNGNKRRKSMDSSLSSNLDVSMTSIPDQYLDSESKLIAENEQLRCELGAANSKIKELEALLRARDEEIELFKKRSYTGYNGRGGGSIREYKQEVRVAALAAFSDGETSIGIRRCWSAITSFVPQLLGPDGQVPSRQTLDRIRDDLVYFNQLQCDQFIQSAEFLVFSVDGTSIGNKKYSVLGMWDHECTYHCLAIDPIDGGTGEIIADLMYKQFCRLNISNEKVLAVMSDKAKAQHKANRLFGEKIGKQLEQLICGQHEVSWLEKYFCNKLLLATEANQTSKQLFGARNSGPTVGFAAVSLKTELDLVFRIEKNINQSGFVTDLGSRYGIYLTNAKQLLLYKDLVIKVLDRQSKTDSRAPSRRLLNLLKNNWKELELELGSIVYYWHTIIGPFSTEMGKYNQLETVKFHHQQLQERIAAVASSNVAFDTLRQCNSDMSRNDPELYTVIDAAWSTASASLKRQTHASVKAAAMNALKKAQADNKMVQDIQADGQLVFPSENRRAEAVFATFKHMARKFDKLIVEKQADVAVSKINHLAQWAYAQDDHEMLRMMHEARVNKKAVWSDRNARKKLFDREMYDRLFLND